MCVCVASKKKSSSPTMPGVCVALPLAITALLIKTAAAA